jgi:hypothetical protein
MTIYGGMRQRLIKDSLYNMVHDSLDALGWFDAGRAHIPINMISKPIDDEGRPVGEGTPIPQNTLSLVPGDLDDEEWEMGSALAEHTWIFYVDFYAQNDAWGLHLIGDVRDILAGRHPDIGRDRTNFPVYDYRQATPPIEFYCDIEEVIVDRAQDFPKPWLKHWYVCRFMVVDFYGN